MSSPVPNPQSDADQLEAAVDHLIRRDAGIEFQRSIIGKVLPVRSFGTGRPS